MSRIPFQTLLVTLFAFTMPSVASGADRSGKLLALEVGEEHYQGRVLAHNEQYCWMLDRRGRTRLIDVASVTRFDERPERFRASSTDDFKADLQSEFGRAYEVRAAGHYIAVAPSGTALSYAKRFDCLYREVTRVFRGRGIDVSEPEFPLVAIVFSDRREFVRYCAREKMNVSPNMVGCYLTTTNRVALYERGRDGDVDTTVVHETVHQVAFNTGLHSRITPHPKWVVEGLATVCEADGMRVRDGQSIPRDRISGERFLWFRDYAKSRRIKNSLADFVSSDQMFDAAAVDAYSEAWALSFFLLETRPQDYSRYLNRQNRRDPFQTYDASRRRQDFEAEFGTDWPAFEVSFLRFMQHLQVR